MNNVFYDYVNNLTNIPCSGYLDLNNMDIEEEEFISHIIFKYKMDMINFEKESHYEYKKEIDGSINKNVLVIKDNIKYHFKINNILYLEYNVTNKDCLDSDGYMLIDIIVYSGLTNHKELILFLGYIDEYIKNKK